MDDSQQTEITPIRALINRFKSDFMAKCGMYGVFFLLFIAIFAPFLANGRPLFIYKNSSIEFPFLYFLFAPDSSEILIEQCFNYIMLISPLLVILYFPFKRYKKITVSLFALFATLLLIPFILTPEKLDKTDWREIDAHLKDGEFAIFAIVPFGPFENVAKPYEKPSKAHILGTDKIGRDLFSRMVYGARVSLAVGIIATAISIIFGTFVGVSMGYLGGRVDFFAMRIVEIIICFPTFLLLLILMTIMHDSHFTQSILLVIAVIGLTSWTGLSRIVRGETLRLKSMPYIQCCKALALPTWRIMFFHIIPNVIGPIMISFSFGVAGAIIAESSLSFLGFGVQPPTASWGGLLRQALEDPFTYWHLTLWPGIALFIAVASFNFAGEGVRKVLDPKS